MKSPKNYFEKKIKKIFYPKKNEKLKKLLVPLKVLKKRKKRLSNEK
jgi:hypothetical protein